MMQVEQDPRLSPLLLEMFCRFTRPTGRSRPRRTPGQSPVFPCISVTRKHRHVQPVPHPNEEYGAKVVPGLPTPPAHAHQKYSARSADQPASSMSPSSGNQATSPRPASNPTTTRHISDVFLVLRNILPRALGALPPTTLTYHLTFNSCCQKSGFVI